jgi:hypothetical protein
MAGSIPTVVNRALLGAVAVLLLLLGFALGSSVTVRRAGEVAPGPVARAPAPPRAMASAFDHWKPVAASSALARFTDAAFANGAFVATDGRIAFLGSATGSERPLDVQAPVRQVFAAGGRLFAAGESDGAPFLIALFDGDAPLVIPLPCAIGRLAGEGEWFAAGCSGGEALALSRDGARTFALLPVSLPALPANAGSPAPPSFEAIAVGSDGSVVFAMTRTWSTPHGEDRLAWTWTHVGVRPPGKPLRYDNLDAFVRVFGLRMDAGVTTLAGLAVSIADGEAGVRRPRMLRSRDSSGFVPMGDDGPACEAAPSLEGDAAVLLGPREAAYLCGGQVVLTLDGGRSHRTEPLVGQVRAIRGGDMRIVADVGGRVLERRFIGRDSGGATAVRVPREGG